MVNLFIEIDSCCSLTTHAATYEYPPRESTALVASSQPEVTVEMALMATFDTNTRRLKDPK